MTLTFDYRKTHKTHSRGTRAAQPLATDVLDGTLYFVTDEGVIERSNGAAWESYSGAGGAPTSSNSVLMLSADGEDGIDGIPGLRGVDGVAGAAGAAGAQGARGANGIDGVDGENAEIMLLGYNSQPSSGGVPGGSDTQVQFNDAGVFGGDAGLTYVKATDTLTVAGGLVVDTTTLVVDNANNRVGVGTASPVEQLEVAKNQNADTRILVSNTDNTNGNSRSSLYLNAGTVQMIHAAIATDAGYFGTGSSHPLVMFTGGSTRVIVGTTGLVRCVAYGSGAATFDASGNITSVSDERFKNIQNQFILGLKELMGIDPIDFKYTQSSGLDTENTYTGFSAQNVMKYVPSAVGKNNDGYYSLNDRTLLATVVNAIKTLKAEVDELRTALGLPRKDYDPKINNYYENGIIKSRKRE